jgi:hypothetical protein
MSESRLSDMSIEDDVERVTLYKQILSYLSNADNSDSIIKYEIKVDEETRPDLLSYRVYSTPDLRWLVMLVAGNDDEFAVIPAGFYIYLPPLSAVRSIIREVRANAV